MYTENRYSKCIPSAAGKLRELGIDEIVEDVERSKLGKHMAKRLFVGFDPLNKRRGMLLRGKNHQVSARSMLFRLGPLTSVDVGEDEAATDDRIGSSMSPVNANQTQDRRRTKSKEATTSR
jgi:hypothetical protein